MSHTTAVTDHLGGRDIELADAIGRQLIRLSRLSESAASQGVKDGPDGLERAGYVLLAHLVERGPLRSGALAEAVWVDPSTVSRQVAQLVKAGLVERRSDPEDGRASRLAATPEGEQLLRRKRQGRNEFLAGMLESWSEVDRVAFVAQLERFVSDYETHLLTLITELAPGAHS